MNSFNKEFYETPTEGIICSSEIEAEGEGFISWEE